MGRVYRAEDTKVKEQVALKLIRPEIAADRKTIDRFRNELKVARAGGGRRSRPALGYLLSGDHFV